MRVQRMMTVLELRWMLSLGAVLIASPTVWGAEPKTTVHQGICDASGVVDLGKGRFAVADDELNKLLIFQADQPGAAIYELEVSKFLDVVKPPKQKKEGQESDKSDQPKKPREPKVLEVDIEAATRVGDTVYWISSHGRKKSGNKAAERMRLFATRIVESGEGVELEPMGTPHDGLLDDLLRDERYVRFGLAEAAEKAPKEPGGLNIEGMTDLPGGALLVGFRSPLIDGQALVATLLNPEQVMQGEEARFAAPKLVDLEGRGIRGMSSHEGQILIAANDPEGDDHRPRLVRWDGQNTQAQPLDTIDFGDFNPEAVTYLPDYRGGKLLLLSDDGTRPIGLDQSPCKKLKDHSQREFRSRTIEFKF